MVNLNYENNRFLEVVNENDEVIDSKSRIDVHGLGLLHREIHVWMFDKDNNIFFQKRGFDRRTAGLLDATVGGHVNKGEDYLKAAVRETKEETGISISPSDLILLRKLRESHPSTDYVLGTFNNFIRQVYLYKHPIKEQMLQKEAGLPGVGFQKISHTLLIKPKKEYQVMFIDFVLNKELPIVISHLKK